MASMTGQDIDDIMANIENGNDPLDDSPTTPVKTPRWRFPRYWPVCPKCGEQMRPDERKRATHDFRCVTCKIEKDIDPNDTYLSRAGVGYDTDVETVSAWLDAPRNLVGAIMLLGDPGTGKTALVEAATAYAERKLLTILCTPDHTKDSLYLRFVGEGQGDPDSKGNPTPYTLGPIPTACKYGYTLYCDEVMMLQDGVKPLLYAPADGRRYLPEGNVDGSALEIHPDFRLIMSSNPQVRGASLPEPLASRCASTTLTVETDGAMLRDLGIDEAVVAAWDYLGEQNLWRPQIRELRLADYWLAHSTDQAVSAMIPEHCPESQRTKVRQAVESFLGGTIRDDGRLVVK